MKRLAYALFFFWGWLPALMAQQGTLWAGLIAGSLKSDIANSSLLNDFVDKPGFLLGGLARYGISDEFSVQFEMLYEQRNFATNTTLLGLRPGTHFEDVCWDCYFRSRVSYKSDFITLPLSGVYERRAKSFVIHARAGLFYGLLLANHHNGFEELYLDPKGMSGIRNPLMEPGLYRTVYSGLSSKVINTYDAGFLLGIGIAYPFGQQTELMLDGRTQIGFAGIYENPNMPVVNYKSYQIRLSLYRKIYQR